MIKWAVELGEYKIEFQTRTAEKGKILGDFMVELTEEPPLETKQWMLHVDGSSSSSNGGVGILIHGPKVLIDGTYETRERTITLYQKNVTELMSVFDKCVVQQIPRSENDRADALSKFGAMLTGIRGRKVTVIVKGKTTISKELEIRTLKEVETWKDEICQYLMNGSLPSDPIRAKRIKLKAARFTLLSGQLYKITIDRPLLRCPSTKESKYVMKEIHEGCCGNQLGVRSLAQKIIRQGYFWPSIVRDTKEYVKKCERCQRYAPLIHQPATIMEPVKIACPFDQWGIDIAGPFSPAQGQKKFLIMAVEYFSKWVEAEAVAKISKKEVISFIWKNIICRFGILRVLISDNGTQFQGKGIVEWCKELKIQQRFTMVGNPQANGQTEVTNRTILQHLKTRISSKRSWVDELQGVLWAYCTTLRTVIGETPFYLVYGTEAIIPAEIGEESH
ncbi:UNVERIFIED_CONTAM: Gag-Pol polyprotein [Sesamum indicum]